MSTKEGFTTFRVYSDDQNGKDPKRQKTRATNNYKEIHGQEPKRIVETPEGGSLPFNCDRCYRIKKKCLKEFPTCNYCAKTGNDTNPKEGAAVPQIPVDGRHTVGSDWVPLPGCFLLTISHFCPCGLGAQRLCGLVCQN